MSIDSLSLIIYLIVINYCFQQLKLKRALQQNINFRKEEAMFDDLNDLQNELQEAAYIPSFSRQGRTGKSLNKIGSVKQIVAAPKLIISMPPQKPKNNLLQLDKNNKSQVKTFQDFFKNQDAQTAKQSKKQQKNELRGIGSIAKRQQFNINSILDQEETFVPNQRRGMKPPISKRNEDNKSVASRFNDDSKSVASVSEVNNNRGQQKNFTGWFNNQAPPLITTQPLPKPDFHNNNNNHHQTAKEPYAEQKQVNNYNLDTSQLKKMLEEQLQLQKQLNQKLLVEERDNHKKEVQKLKSMHQEQLKAKLQLKDLRIEKLKEFYDMELKVKHERDGEMKELSHASQKIEEGIRAMKHAQQQFKIKTTRYEQQKKAKRNQTKTFQDFTKEKETYIQELFTKLQSKQKDFKEQKNKFQQQKQRARKKIQDQESKLHRRERQLQQKHLKKERQLVEDFDVKKRHLQEQEHQLKIEKMDVQASKLKYQQEREEVFLRQKKWDQNKNKLMEEIQAEKIKLMSKQIELDSKYRQWESKEDEIIMKQKEMLGKFRLIQLERKKVDIQRDMKQKVDTSKYKFSFDRENEASPLQKSIRQLKDEYLRNLGHI